MGSRCMLTVNILPHIVHIKDVKLFSHHDIILSKVVSHTWRGFPHKEPNSHKHWGEDT